MQSLDKGLADCKDETHVKSFHDAPDKVSFRSFSHGLALLYSLPAMPASC